jgi:hypothetical protein
MSEPKPPAGAGAQSAPPDDAHRLRLQVLASALTRVVNWATLRLDVGPGDEGDDFVEHLRRHVAASVLGLDDALAEIDGRFPPDELEDLEPEDPDPPEFMAFAEARNVVFRVLKRAGYESRPTVEPDGRLSWRQFPPRGPSLDDLLAGMPSPEEIRAKGAEDPGYVPPIAPPPGGWPEEGETVVTWGELARLRACKAILETAAEGDPPRKEDPADDRIVNSMNFFAAAIGRSPKGGLMEALLDEGRIVAMEIRNRKYAVKFRDPQEHAKVRELDERERAKRVDQRFRARASRRGKRDFS